MLSVTGTLCADSCERQAARHAAGSGDAPSATRWAIATYTLDCGHQAVEMLQQDPDSAPFWVERGAVDHLAARDARSLARLLLDASTLEEAHQLIESAQANLATHTDGHPDDELEGPDGH